MQRRAKIFDCLRLCNKNLLAREIKNAATAHLRARSLLYRPRLRVSRHPVLCFQIIFPNNWGRDWPAKTSKSFPSLRQAAFSQLYTNENLHRIHQDNLELRHINTVWKCNFRHPDIWTVRTDGMHLLKKLMKTNLIKAINLIFFLI